MPFLGALDLRLVVLVAGFFRASLEGNFEGIALFISASLYAVVFFH